MPDASSHFSPSIMAVIITLPLLFLCLVCSIGIWLCIKRRRRLNRVSSDTTEKAMKSGQRHSQRTTPSNLSEFGVEAQTIQERFTTMGPNAAAAILESNSRMDTQSRRRQLASTIPPGTASRYPPTVIRQAARRRSLASDALDEHPTTLPAGRVAPSQPLASLTKPPRSMRPPSFFARLSQNIAAAFRSPSPEELAVVDGDGEASSIADSYSTPMALGMRLNYQPAATAASTFYGSDTEVGSTKDDKLRSSMASDRAMTDESIRATSLSSRGHSQSHRGRKVHFIHPNYTEYNTDFDLVCFLHVQRGEPLPLYALNIPSDSPAQESAQNGQLGSSASSGMLTALTHQTIDLAMNNA